MNIQNRNFNHSAREEVTSFAINYQECVRQYLHVSHGNQSRIYDFKTLNSEIYLQVAKYYILPTLISYNQYIFTYKHVQYLKSTHMCYIRCILGDSINSERKPLVFTIIICMKRTSYRDVKSLLQNDDSILYYMVEIREYFVL